jgi:hypothetical protein
MFESCWRPASQFQNHKHFVSVAQKARSDGRNKPQACLLQQQSMMEVEQDDPIDLEEMAEKTVGTGTFNGCKLSILKIAAWAWENEVDWLTEDFVGDCKEVLLEAANMGVQARSSHPKERTREKLVHADADPILVVENVTLEGFMEHLESLRHQRTGGRLSKSQHGNKRAALHHLFRCHVGPDGCPDGFKDRLSNLIRGFARVLTQRDQDDSGDVSEAREGCHVSGSSPCSSCVVPSERNNGGNLVSLFPDAHLESHALREQHNGNLLESHELVPGLFEDSFPATKR